MASEYFTYLAKKNPILSYKLQQAGIPDKAEDFIQKAYMLSAFLAVVLGVVVFIFLNTFQQNKLWSIPTAIVLFFFLRTFFLHQPDAMLSKKEKNINKELVFASRFLLIEIQSGVPLFNAMINISDHYQYIGKEFKDIVNIVNLGTSLEDSIEQISERTPSISFRKVLWQILNSLKTGADISTSLEAAINQITREQMIEVEEYGRKLNPLAMFYMILAVILPSIGITMLVLVSNFLSLSLGLAALLSITGFLSLMQFMFFNVIKNMRPPVDI